LRRDLATAPSAKTLVSLDRAGRCAAPGCQPCPTPPFYGRLVVDDSRVSIDRLLSIQRSSYAGATPRFREGWPEADALQHDELAALLDRHPYCVLATARADGRAHAAPVAFVIHDGAFWFATVAGLRLRNLKAQPWAALVIMEGDADVGEVGQPHVALTVEGPVVLHPIDDWHLFETEWLRRHTDPPTWAVALAELRPERLFSHAARAQG